MRTVGTTAALFVGLAILGALAGPDWTPVPVRDQIEPASSYTLIGGTEAGRADGRIHPPGTFDFTTTEVEIQLDGYEVAGLLREPVGAGDGLAGMVFVHGAGTGKAYEAFVAQAEQLASAGVVTLVPDKRLDTHTLWHRDYEMMALDYLHSVDFLRQVPSVDPARVGVYGESEGTWIVPIMQVEDPDIAFTVLASAPVVEPRLLAAFAVDNFLRNTNVPAQVFRAIPRAVGMQFPQGILTYADFDVSPWLQRQTAPVLVVYGAADPSQPMVQATRQIIADTALGSRDAPVTVRFYEGADHGLRVGGRVVPELSRDIAAWVQGLPETADADPRIAGAQPEQLFLASPMPQPRWWGSGEIVIGTVIAGVVLLLLGPVVWLATALLRRLAAVGRGSLGTVPSAALARGLPADLLGLGAGSVMTLVALVWYLIGIANLAVNYQRADLIVQGGWLAVRLLGVGTVVFAALLINLARDGWRARRAGEPRVALVTGWPAHVTVWTSVAGSALLLVWLTYWGVFQLGI